MNHLDLTRPLVPGMPVWPGDPEFETVDVASLRSDGFCVTRLTMGSHLGTHLDAPAHYLPEGAGVDAIPLDRLIGEAVVIRVPCTAEERIDVADLEPFVACFRRGAKVLFDTGWASRFGSDDYFLRAPGLTLEAARWIAACHVDLVGFDGPTPSNLPGVHETLLGADVVIVESLTNLSDLPDRFTLVVLPLPFVGLDGSPVRAVASW